MKHDPYSLTELIRNDDFIAWVRHPTADSSTRWERFLELHPEKKQVLDDARGYVNLLAEDTGKHKPTIEQTNKMWRAVEIHLHEENVEDPAPEKTYPMWRWMRTAASIALILGVGVASYWYVTDHQNKLRLTDDNKTKTGAEHLLIEKFNNSQKPMTVLLTDGSSVVLQPGAELKFSSKDDPKKREVYLIGKAFFEVVRNPSRPFLVYTDGLATKVLGTSFSIDAPNGSEDIKVEVKTGRVSVFQVGKNPSAKEVADVEAAELQGVILKHDQRMSISRQNGRPVKPSINLAEQSQTRDISNQLFIFDETPVSQVFSALESAYNIEIVYDRSLLGDCPLNATLVGQPFMEKLSVICTALEAQYELRDNQVIIKGKGCK